MRPELDRPAELTFTRFYHQPADYHFCQDSVILPYFVAERLKARAIGDDFRVLDVCAGCGVIGLELAHHEPRFKQIEFLEVQAIFAESLAANAPGATIHRASYKALAEPQFRERYDLIVGNPPYFMPGDGKLSPHPTQNRCRFFLDAAPEVLVRGVIHALRPGGEAFLLMKSGAQHGRTLERSLALWSAGLAEIEIPAAVRGTEIVHLRKIAIP